MKKVYCAVLVTFHAELVVRIFSTKEKCKEYIKASKDNLHMQEHDVIE